MHIVSDDVYAPLDFDSGFMTKYVQYHQPRIQYSRTDSWHPCRLSDLAILRWAYKRSREIMRRLPVYRGAVPQSHPTFPEGSKAMTTAETGPVDLTAPKIIYTADDDAAIDDYHRRTGMLFELSSPKATELTNTNSCDNMALSMFRLCIRRYLLTR